MKAKSKAETCIICSTIPDYLNESNNEIEPYRNKLTWIGRGSYYRGEELQLSNFNLLQCPKCRTYYEDAHHYYSDPESTMGLGRDESDWYVLARLSQEKAKERRKQIK